jgi:NitT/TauT family transport system substrate-binding protein
LLAGGDGASLAVTLEMIDKRFVAVFALITAFGLIAPASAAVKVVAGFTAVSDCDALFVAKEMGFFAKRGLDLDLQLLSNSNVLAQSMVAGSVQVGCTVPPVLLSAVAAGIDLVGIAGATVTTRNLTTIGAVMRTGLTINTPHDYIGKKIAVSGLGSTLDILFSQWLVQKHVDPKQVTFVEASFSAQGDLLKAGNVDVVLTADPFLSRIVSAGTGYVASYFPAELPEGTRLVIYDSTREWAKNVAQRKAFQDAIAEGSQYGQLHKEIDDVAISTYLGLSLPAVQSLKRSPADTKLTAAQLQWWIDAMTREGLLTSPVNARSIIE